MLTRRGSLFVAVLAILIGLFPVAGCSHRERTQAQLARSRGAELFEKNCLVCHGSSAGEMRIGRPLTGEGHRKSLAEIVQAIEAPDPPMPKLYPGTLSERDVADIAEYVKTL